MVLILFEDLTGRGGDYRGNNSVSSVIASLTIKLAHLSSCAFVRATIRARHLQSILPDTLERGLSSLNRTLILRITRLRLCRRSATLRQGPDDDIVLHAISHDQ
jgi:hypothetical protein